MMWTRKCLKGTRVARFSKSNESTHELIVL